MKYKACVFSPKPTIHVKMFAKKNYLNEPRDTKFQKTIKNIIKEWQEFTQTTKKQFNEIKEKELKEDENLQEA